MYNFVPFGETRSKKNATGLRVASIALALSPQRQLDQLDQLDQLEGYRGTERHLQILTVQTAPGGSC